MLFVSALCEYVCIEYHYIFRCIYNYIFFSSSLRFTFAAGAAIQDPVLFSSYVYIPFHAQCICSCFNWNQDQSRTMSYRIKNFFFRHDLFEFFVIAFEQSLLLVLVLIWLMPLLFFFFRLSLSLFFRLILDRF